MRRPQGAAPVAALPPLLHRQTPVAALPPTPAFDDWASAYRATPMPAFAAQASGTGSGASVARALGAAFGRLGAVLVALFFAYAAVGYLSDSHEDAAAVASLLITGSVWLGGTAWAAWRAGWKWALAFFLCWPVALPWSSYRQARLPEGRRAFTVPAFWAAGGLATVGSVLLLVGIFSGAPAGPAEAGGAANGGPVAAMLAPTEQPRGSLLAERPTQTAPRSTSTATPSPTAKPTQTPTPEPTDTPRPTKTATPKPTKTPTPRPTRTPRPKPTRTPRPSASFDPAQTADLLHSEPFLSDEYFGYGRPVVYWSDEPYDGSVGDITVEANVAVLRYVVFRSDREARQFVRGFQTGQEWPMADYPDVSDVAAGYIDDGTYYYAAAIGNVVVFSATSDELLIAEGLYDPAYDTVVAAAVETELGVRHLLRIVGEPSPSGADVGVY